MTGRRGVVPGGSRLMVWMVVDGILKLHRLVGSGNVRGGAWS